MAEASVPIPRRNWLLHALQASVAATVAAILYPVVRFVRPRATTNSGALEVVAPYRVNELKPDAEGQWPPPFNFGGKPCLLIRTPDGEIKAFNAVCTHLECTVEFRAGQGRHLLQLPQRRLRLERAQRLRPAAAASGGLQGDPPGRQTRTGGDPCLPKHLMNVSAGSTRHPAPDGVLLRAAWGSTSSKPWPPRSTCPSTGTTVFYFLGGMALFLFGIQVATGILLSLYYKPSPDQAFESVRAIMTEIDFGWLIRSIHVWSANLLIGVLFLHILTTYIMRAYRGPREITWITGVVLLGLFLAFGFSGYLLPWNQLAFFATRVGTAIVGVVPVVGQDLLLLARSGENVTGDTLARFYALHVVILPLVAFALVGVHLFLVQKHGMSVPESAAKRYGGPDNVPSDAVCAAFPAPRHGRLVRGLGTAGGLGGAVSLGTRARRPTRSDRRPRGSSRSGISFSCFKR